MVIHKTLTANEFVAVLKRDMVSILRIVLSGTLSHLLGTGFGIEFSQNNIGILST
jgi:hypothetical protein